MEFLPSEIARLVLGYLEDEKCESAYETFLTTSPNLTECLKMREMGKKFRTQVIGLSLRDILHEYSTIYYSVHERLKKVDPETADSLRNSGSLLDKLTFLLNANGSGQTMLFSITLPHGKSPTTSAVAHVRKKFKPSGLDKSKEKSKKIRAKSEGEPVCDELNISQINPCDVDATPLCSLPGNNSTSINQNVINEEHESISRTPKRKSTNIRKSRTNSSLSGVMEESLDFSVLTKVLIENHELHEKLAENINKVICTPENTNPVNKPVTQPQSEPSQIEITKPDLTAAYSASFNNELDHMIKKVVEQTESDPLFENIIFEALVPSTEETSDDCEERRMSSTSTPRKYTHNNDGSNSSDQEITSKNYRHTRSKSSSSNEHVDDLSKNIDDQNADAIKSIIAVNSQQKELQENLDALVEAAEIQLETSTLTENQTITKQTVTTVETKTTETISSIQAKIPAVEQSSIVVISQPQVTVTSQPTYVLTTAHTPFPIQNQVVLIDGKNTPLTQQIIIQQPQTSYQTLHLTERDIMSMPTVIMYGDERKYTNNTITTSYKPKYSNPPPLAKIRPKEPIESKKAAQLSITLYAGDDKSSNEAKMDIKPVGKNLQVTISPVKPGKSVPMILSETKDVDEIPLTTPKIKTPTTDTQQRQSLSTPRSAKSHIRALDFSTPSKDGPSTRKANTSPKGVKRSLIKKTPKRKDLRTSLFQNTSTPTIPIATRTPTVKLCGEWDNIQGTGLIIGQNVEAPTKPKKKFNSWDEDLRALCSVNESVKTVSPKKSKKKTPKRKAKKKSLGLNKTEEEVNKIEAALSSSLDDTKKEIKENTEDDSVSEEVKTEQIKEVKKVKSKKDGKRTVKKDTKEDVKKVESELKVVLEPLSALEPQINIRNMRPRLKKKCNITNPPITSTQNEQISCRIEQEDNPNSMTITLSGKLDNEEEKLIKKLDEDEKLNVDVKSNIVTDSVNVVTIDQSNIEDEKSNVITVESNVIVIEKSNVVVEPAIVQVEKQMICIDNPQVVIEKLEMNTSQSRITPTNQRIINEQPITFKSNLTPILETPIKFDSLGHPITPKIFTPFSMTTDTPFSKLLNENIGSVDLSSIATPSFPLTPNFSLNITPGSQAGDAPYNRPTDYSTSSSYYQPSDTDQNQVIDQVLIEESKNMDKQKRDKKIQPMNADKLLPDAEIDRKKFTADYVLHEISLNSPAKTGIVDKSKYSIISPNTEKLNEIENEANVSVVDSEKLNSSSSSSSSDSSYSSSDSTDDSTDDSSDKSETTNNTVIHRPKEEVQTRYSLRTQKTPCKNVVTPMKIIRKKVIKNNSKELINSSLDEDVKTKETSPKIEIKIDKKTNDKLNEPSTSTGRVARPKSKVMVSPSFFNTLEEKRLRVVTAIKNPKKKPPARRKPPIRKASVNARKKKQTEETNTERDIEANTKKEMETNTKKEIETNTKKDIETSTAKDIKPSTKKDIETSTAKDIKSNTKKEIKPSNKKEIETSSNQEKKTTTKNENEMSIKKEIEASSKKEIDDSAKEEIEEGAKKETETNKDTSKSNKKSKNTRNGKSIESVAMKLKQLNGNKDSEQKMTNDSKENTSKRKREISENETEDEIPHLLISSDEEEVISSNVKNPVKPDTYVMLEETERKKLEELKERGIHLIPKEKKNPKVQIKNIVVLEKDEKIDFSKVTDCIKTDVICKKDTKTDPKPIDVVDSSEKLDCSMESYQFSLEDDAPLPAEANFEEHAYTENSPCFFKCTYDESTVCNRTLEDYDFADLSQKTISAQVFVSELNTLMTRTMTFSPYVELYSYNSYRKRIAPIRIENIKRIQNNRQLKIEAKKIEDEKKMETKKIEVEKSLKLEVKKIEDVSKNKSKSADDKKKVTKCVKTNERKSGNKINLEQYKSKYKEQNVTSDETVDIYSDLPEDLSCKKRKLGSDVNDGRLEKRNKSIDQRALLDDLDLELILTTVHGPSKKS